MSTKSITVPLARGMEAADHGTKPHCLNKPPKVKGYTVHPHDGMRSTNPHTGKSEWGGHGASYDANPANPLKAGPPRGKVLSPVQPSPTMRSRTNEDQLKPSVADELARILNEANSARGMDYSDRVRFRTLPETVEED